jgi:hypothetical protein
MDPIRSEQDYTLVSSGHIWPVVIIPIITALGGIVLSMRRGKGMASDQTEVTAVSSVLMGLVRRAYSCQSRHAWLGLTSPRSFQGS